MFLATRSDGDDGVPRTEGATHPGRDFLGDRAWQLSLNYLLPLPFFDHNNTINNVYGSNIIYD
jgi:hypothetical protein